jgi:transcriptional regulator of heat shock response
MSMLRGARAEAARRAARHHVMAKTWDLLAEDIAEKLGMLGVVGVQGDEVYKEGIARLVSSGAWDSHEAITEILEDFEGLDQRIPRAMENLEDDMPQVFIGRKSPVTRSDALAVLSQVLDVDGQRISVFAIGPKRMDYASAIALFKKLFL